MMCEFCEILEGKSKAEIIYEDNDVCVAVRDHVAIPGQITVFPKKHLTIMELVPDDILEKCALVANKVGVAVFESLGCEGTNLFVQNGVSAGQKIPHFGIEILPRREGDGLNLMWNPQELGEDEIDTTYLMLKEECDKLIDIGKKKKVVEEEQKEKIKESDEKTEEKENYLLKSQRRIP